jgi:MFS family permease
MLFGSEAGAKRVRSRTSWLLLAAILAVGTARIVSTYGQLSVTVDEPFHFACGLQYLSRRVYTCETQHPPLARALAAAIPYARGMRSAGEPDVWSEAPALFPPGRRTDRTIVEMRLGVLPFFWIATVVVFLWARRDFGSGVAVIAAAVFSAIPPVLAHAGLATTDMALTACLSAAFYSLIRWAEMPTPGRALLLGIWSALAALSKFSAMLYFPVAAVLALAGFAALQRPGWRGLARLAKRRAATFALAIAVALVIVWGAYFFSFGAVPAWRGRPNGPLPAWLADARLPAPELIDGLQSVYSHNKRGHQSFLLGESSWKGWWRFFPVVFGVKTPIAVLVLFFAGLFACRFWRSMAGWLPVAFFAAVFGSAMPGHINLGVRHVLPVYVPVAILAAVALARLARPWSGTAAAAAIAGGLLCVLVPGALAHPDYLAYMNAFAGRAPEEVVADSDLEWGQDYRLLAKRLHELGAREVGMRVVEYRLDDLAWLERQYGLPPVHPVDPQVPAAGWNVISATQADVHDGGWRRHGKTAEGPWWSRAYPTERIGGLLLYYVPKP